MSDVAIRPEGECARAPESDDAELAQRYGAVRRRTERLCAPLSPEDAVVQSMPEASPAKWHLAHTTWFFETFVLEQAVAAYVPVDPAYRVLFNSYYNTVGPMHARPERGMLTRPSLDDVRAYRRRVDEAVSQWLAASAGDSRPSCRRLRNVVVLGLHHEQQHQELILTDLKHALSRNPLRPAYRARPDAPDAQSDEARGASAAETLRWIDFDEGLHDIGAPGEGFSFDNERPRHRGFVHAFQLASRPVTNGEYLAFIEDGGYERADLWLSDGWAWVRRNDARTPFYWEPDGERDPESRLEFTLAGLEPLDRSAPVCHVSFYEANAFARWAGARLPTEQEWEVAAHDLPIAGNFADEERFHPIGAASPGRGGFASAASLPRRMFGDVWEWTGSAYLPYPGYREPEGALGEYNGKFMSGQMVLRGGSCATPRSHVRASYRNFFAPDARWQFSGIRLARDAGGSQPA